MARTRDVVIIQNLDLVSMKTTSSLGKQFRRVDADAQNVGGVGKKSSQTPQAATPAAKAPTTTKAEQVNKVAAEFQTAPMAEANAETVTGQEHQKEPSKALNQAGRIMSPHLLFKEFNAKNEKPNDAAINAPGAKEAVKPNDDDNASLLEALLDQPFRPSSETKESATVREVQDVGPMVATLPPSRKTPVGAVTYAHENGVLTITGEGTDPNKPEVLTKKMGLGRAAQFASAFDAAIAATYPRFSTQEPHEMWVGIAGADKAAQVALKLDAGGRSPYAAAKLLRGFMPKANPIVATKTVMDQIKMMAGLASKVVDGNPAENLVNLEEQSLQAKGSSLLNEAIKAHDRKTGARTELDDILDQPVKPADLPANDSAVVASVDGRDVTAGEIREKAFSTQKAVAFQVEGFADEYGSQQTMTLQIEKRGKGLEWSFHGVAGDRKKIHSGDLSAEGLTKFKAAVDMQPRYDMIKYENKVPKFSPRLAEASMARLDADREKMDEEAKARGYTPVSEIFPDLAR